MRIYKYNDVLVQPFIIYRQLLHALIVVVKPRRRIYGERCAIGESAIADASCMASVPSQPQNAAAAIDTFYARASCCNLYGKDRYVSRTGTTQLERMPGRPPRVTTGSLLPALRGLSIAFAASTDDRQSHYTGGARSVPSCVRCPTDDDVHQFSNYVRRRPPSRRARTCQFPPPDRHGNGRRARHPAARMRVANVTDRESTGRGGEKPRCPSPVPGRAVLK